MDAKLTEEQVKNNEGLKIELKEKKKDETAEEGEKKEGKTIEVVPFPKLDEEFTDKVSFADRCKLMQPIVKKYLYKRVIRPPPPPPLPPSMSKSKPRAVTGEYAFLFHINIFLEEIYEVPLDSTYIRKTPILDLCRRLMRGYQTALQTMKVGEMAEFAIHYRLAHDELGCPPRIPPRSNLIVIIEVLDAFEQGSLNYFHLLSSEEQYEEVEKAGEGGEAGVIKSYATDDLKAGNEQFREGNHLKAIAHFCRAIELLERFKGGILSNSVREDVVSYNQLLLALYQNAAICEFQLKNGPSTVKLSLQALRLDGSSARVHFLLGQGYMMLKKLEQAKLHLLRAQSSRPLDQDVSAALEKLDQLMAESGGEPGGEEEDTFGTKELLKKLALEFYPNEKPETKERTSSAYEEATEKSQPDPASILLNMLGAMEEGEPMWDMSEYE